MITPVTIVETDPSTSTRFQGERTFSSKLVVEKTTFAWNFVLSTSSLLEKNARALEILHSTRSCTWILKANAYVY